MWAIPVGNLASQSAASLRSNLAVQVAQGSSFPLPAATMGQLQAEESFDGSVVHLAEV